MKDEDYAFEQRCQAQIDAENSTDWPQWHQKVGAVLVAWWTGVL
jgi:HD superfamily phosphohydrolase YqeK